VYAVPPAGPRQDFLDRDRRRDRRRSRRRVHAGDSFHDRRPELTDLMPAATTSDYAALTITTRPTLPFVAHGLLRSRSVTRTGTRKRCSRRATWTSTRCFGDNHTPDVAKVDGTRVTYPVDRARQRERARGRGYNPSVTFDADAAGGDDRVEIRRRALDTRPFVFVEVDLREGRGRGAGAREGPPTRPRRRRRPRRRDRRGDPVTPAAIEEFATDEGALIARVTDRREGDGCRDRCEFR